MYSIGTFLKPLSSTDVNIQIMDVNSKIMWTINPFTIKNTFVSNNLVRITQNSESIVLDFSTTNEAKQALVKLQSALDILRNKTPLVIDKAIENWVNNNSIASNVSYEPTGSLTASNVQDAIDQVENQISSISASTTGYFLPADPNTTTSTAGVMMGLGSTVSFTPTRTGKIMIILSGDGDNATNARGANVQMRYGTGVAPANGAALTGTTVGTLIQIFGDAADIFPFTLNGIVSGLSVGTAIWVDISLASVGAGTNTARVRDIMVSIIEI